MQSKAGMTNRQLTSWLGLTGLATRFIHLERSICQQHIKEGQVKTEDTTPDCPATKPHGPGTPWLIRAPCSSTQPHDSTACSLFDFTVHLRPDKRAASGTSLLAADQRPLHYIATQLYIAVIIAGENPVADPQDQITTIKLPILRCQTVQQLETTINIVMCVILWLSLWTVPRYPTLLYPLPKSCLTLINLFVI